MLGLQTGLPHLFLHLPLAAPDGVVKLPLTEWSKMEGRNTKTQVGRPSPAVRASTFQAPALMTCSGHLPSFPVGGWVLERQMMVWATILNTSNMKAANKEIKIFRN